MAVRELTAPLSSRSRKPKHPFTDAEVKESVKMLEGGKTPGVGPFEGENGLREARSAAQSLGRHIAVIKPDLNIGTRAWEDEDGKCFAILRVKD